MTPSRKILVSLATLSAALAAVALGALPTAAHVAHLVIDSRHPLDGGGGPDGTIAYEVINGHFEGALDPADPRNAIITDIGLAPRDADGQVAYSSNFTIVKPIDMNRSTGVLYDMIPNRGNHLWLEADQPGYYWGQCAEFCGDSHAVMRFRVIALGPKEFNDWVTQQMEPAREVKPAADQPAKPQFASYRQDWKRNEKGYTAEFDLDPLNAWRAHQFPNKNEDPALIAKGRELFQSKTCFSCHVVRGMVGGSSAYPDLTHFGSRTTLAAGVLENNAEQLARWIAHPNEVKPGNKMYANGYIPNHIELTSDDIAALVAFLESLK